MPKRIRSLKVLEGSLVDNPANPGARVLLYKRGEPAQDEPITGKAEVEKDHDMAKTLEDLQKELEQLSAEVGDLTKANAELEKAKADAEKATADALAKVADLQKAAGSSQPEDDPDELLKGLPKPLRLEIEDMRKRDREREADVAKLRLEREEESAIAKVEKEWPSIGKAYVLGPVYRKIAKALDDKELSALEAVFKSHEEFAKIAQSVIGRPGGGASSVDAEVAAMVADMRKADPKLSEAAARAKVWDQNPDLLKRYRDSAH